ncbi:MAG: aminotransferase class III-fold pyridoxal phosphate-dependent enzyme, partial [Desulfobulbia bacterium]
CMGDVRGMGLMIGVELVKDGETKERAGDWRDQVIQQAFRKGLLLLGCGENTLRICPALTVNSQEVDVFLTIFEESLRELFS